MHDFIDKVASVSIQIERAGGLLRFVWEELFLTEQPNPYRLLEQYDNISNILDVALYIIDLQKAEIDKLTEEYVLQINEQKTNSDRNIDINTYLFKTEARAAVDEGFKKAFEGLFVNGEYKDIDLARYLYGSGFGDGVKFANTLACDNEAVHRTKDGVAV